MTRYIVIAAAVLIAGCDAAPPTEPLVPMAQADLAIASGVTASVTGSGNVQGAPTDWFGQRVFTLAANKRSDGSVSGHFNLKYAPVAGEQLAGTVTCLAVDGNTAYVGATVEKHAFILPPGVELTGVAIEIEDNGVGADAPDRISFIFYYLNDPDGPQSYCDAPVPTDDAFMLDIDRGNLTVR